MVKKVENQNEEKEKQEEKEIPTLEKTDSVESEEPVATGSNPDSIADSLAEEQPGVSEHVIEQENAKREQRAANAEGLTDSDGNSFDPSIHVTDEDGNPKTTTTGKLRKRPGRKAGGSTIQGRPASHVGLGASTHQNSGQVNTDQMAIEKRRATGQHAAKMLTGVAQMVGGEEWKPMKIPDQGIDEQKHLNEAFADYFEAKEMDDMPPGMVLSVVVLSYAAPRFAMPQTKTRMQKAKEWIAHKYLNWKHGGKKKKAVVKEKDKEEDK